MRYAAFTFQIVFGPEKFLSITAILIPYRLLDEALLTAILLLS